MDTVSNFMRDFAYHVDVYGIAYRENIKEAGLQIRRGEPEEAVPKPRRHTA